MIDDSFVEEVWQWLSRNPEVTVDDKSSPENVAPSSDVKTQTGELRHDASTQLEKYRNQRLCTGEERVWYAIAGHGIDHKRIPPLEFQALSVIAAQGSKGVLQPDVTKLTGQDKRSLPKRTDNLAKNGYIVKTIVIARGTKTSLLKLKKFAGDNGLPEDQSAIPGTVIIQYDEWFDETMRQLKKNDNIIAFEDLRIGLGINKRRFETRALHRCVRRLVNVGVLRKVTARVEAPASDPDAEMKSVRSLQLLREPTEIDRVAFTRSDWQRSKLLDSAQVAQFAALGTNEDEEDEDEDDAEALAGLDGEAEDPKRTLRRTPPSWTPDLPFVNLLFRRIEEAGVEGTSSSELYEATVGHFWKRAMDDMLVKLTDLWQFSQPPHLRHLSIVKDTGQRGKQPTFQYRSHGNFEKAVEIGDAFWEGVYGTEEKGKGKTGKKKAEAAASAQPDLDAWGFPKLSPKLFVGQSGSATLEECRRSAKIVSQPMSTILNGGTVGRPPKNPLGSPKRPRGRPKKTQLANRTPKSQTRQKKWKKNQIIDEVLSDDATEQTPSVLLKRTADEASLDDNDGHEAGERSSAVSETGSLSRGPNRPRKIFRPAGTLDAVSDATPGNQDPDTLQNVENGEELEAAASGERASGSHERSIQSDVAKKRRRQLNVKPGVAINPPGAFELKKFTLQSRGRPPKAKIAVFTSNRLVEFSWFADDSHSLSFKKQKRTPKNSKAQVQEPASQGEEPTVEPQADSATVAPRVTHTASHEPLQSVAGGLGSNATQDPQDMDTVPGADSNEELTSDALPKITVHSPEKDEGPTRTYKKAGVTKNIGALHIKRRKVALDIIRTCGGVFPGKGEIQFPFATVWQREHKQVPDRQTVDNVIKGLITSGKLKKLTFFFKSKKGLTVERSILVEPEIDPNSPKVKLLQKKIIESFPATVLPEEADVSPEFRKQAKLSTQISHNGKSAKPPGQAGPPTPAVEATPKQLPPHYIRDEFPTDASVTVKRTSNPIGLGATDAALASIKRSRKIASIKRGGRPRKILPLGPGSDDEMGELTYEEAMLQGGQEQFPYSRSRNTNRVARAGRVRGSGSRKLPGRILGSKGSRKAAAGSNARASRTAINLPWNSIGYVASQVAHSSVEPQWIATISKVKPQPKRIGRIHWQWVDPSLADWKVQPTEWASDGEGDEPDSHESPSFGLLLPEDTQLVDNHELTQNADVQFVPQTLEEIVNSQLLPPDQAPRRNSNEATNFFDEVDRVEAWERKVIKSKQSLARGAELPFINYTSPATIEWPLQNGRPHETPRARTRKRGRGDDDDDAQTPRSKRTRRVRTKASIRAQQGMLREDDPRRYRKRNRKAAANFGERDHDRLTKAIALVSAVAGGLSYRRNWYIISHAFAYQFESEFLRHRWDKVRDQKEGLVKQMQAQIWEPFLDAYERGSLPAIDFEDLEGTDWPALMEWVEDEVLTSSTNYAKPVPAISRVPNLPPTVHELQSDFMVTETMVDLNAGREEFFTAVVDKRRKDVAVTNLNGTSINVTSSAVADHDSNELLRSWARAVVLTDEKNYNSDEAHRKISQFGDAVLESTVRELCAEKILQQRKRGRRLPGRNLKLDDAAFLPVFKRWSEKQGPEHQYLIRVAKRRADILEILRTQDHYELAYSAEDEIYAVLTNMVSQGLLKVKSLLPERNDNFDAPFPKLTVWGYSGYNYNVRTFDKTRLRFRIVYEKTDKFTFEHGLRNDVLVPLHPPQLPNEAGLRLPLWTDIHDRLLPRMWEMALRSVLYLIVFRPGMSASELEDTHKGKIWSWEIDLLLKWMEDTGLAERTGPGDEINGVWKGGWKATDWWYCAFCPDMLRWTALSK